MKSDNITFDSLLSGAGALNPDRYFLLKHIGFDKRIIKADGHYYHDVSGTAYLDFLAQYGAVPFGHNPTPLWDYGRVQWRARCRDCSHYLGIAGVGGRGDWHRRQLLAR